MTEADSPAKPSAEPTEPLTGQAVVTLVAAWLVPGAGHFMLGKMRRGAIFLLLVMVAIGVGCLLQGNLYRVLPNQPLTILATLGSMGMGLPYFGLRFIFGR